jgi:hypothetical protein
MENLLKTGESSKNKSTNKINKKSLRIFEMNVIKKFYITERTFFIF